jgi:hypothetical protein
MKQRLGIPFTEMFSHSFKKLLLYTQMPSEVPDSDFTTRNLTEHIPRFIYLHCNQEECKEVYAKVNGVI